MVEVPIEIAGPIALAGTAAIGMLWHRNVELEDRMQANIERAVESNNSVVRALDALAQMINRAPR